MEGKKKINKKEEKGEEREEWKEKMKKECEMKRNEWIGRWRKWKLKRRKIEKVKKVWELQNENKQIDEKKNRVERQVKKVLRKWRKGEIQNPKQTN